MQGYGASLKWHNRLFIICSSCNTILFFIVHWYRKVTLLSSMNYVCMPSKNNVDNFYTRDHKTTVWERQYCQVCPALPFYGPQFTFLYNWTTFFEHIMYCLLFTNWLVTAVSLWRPGFNPRSVSVRLVVDKVPLGWVFHEYFNIIL